MEREPETEFEQFEQRTIQWKRLGQTVVGLYRHLTDDTMHVLVQDNHPKDGESYYVVSCGGHPVYDVYRNPWDYR